MTEETKPKVRDLEKQQEEQLTPEQAEEVQGGVIAVSHAITSPRDPASGLPTGK